MCLLVTQNSILTYAGLMEKNMNWFKIQSIEYGWWEAQIGACYIECSNYLNYDMPKELLRKILRLLKGSSVEEWLYIMNEPGASMICIQLNYNKINFTEYNSLKTSHELNLHEKKESWENVFIQ